jgi:hypothetical protein
MQHLSDLLPISPFPSCPSKLISPLDSHPATQAQASRSAAITAAVLHRILSHRGLLEHLTGIQQQVYRRQWNEAFGGEHVGQGEAWSDDFGADGGEVGQAGGEAGPVVL